MTRDEEWRKRVKHKMLLRRAELGASGQMEYIFMARLASMEMQLAFMGRGHVA